MRIARSTLILIVANLLAFGLIWKSTRQHAPISIAQNFLFSSDIAKIELVDQEKKLNLEKKNGYWYVTTPYTWPANLWAVQRLLDEVRYIDAEKGFLTTEAKVGSGNLSVYGLEKPRWILKTTSETGITVEVKIGENKDTRQTFLLIPNGEKIIPLGDALAAALDAKPETYRIDKVFEINEFEARTISVRQKNSESDALTTLTLEERTRVGHRNQGPEWRFEAPFDHLADAERANKAITNLLNAKTITFFENPQEETGLAAPEWRIGVEGNSRRQVLLLGKPKIGSASQRWAKLEENESVFLLDTQNLTEWFNPRETLNSTRPTDFDYELATGFTLTSGGRSITLHRLDSATGEARWEIPVAPGSTATQRREANATKTTEFLTALSQLRALRQPGKSGDQAGPWLIPANTITAKPLQKIDVEFGGDRVVIFFYPAPENHPSSTLLVHQKGSAFAAVCEVSLLKNNHLNVAPQYWRSRIVTELTAGAKVSGLRLVRRQDNKVLGEARLSPEGNWIGTGALDATLSRRLATAFAQVKAVEFPTREIGAGEWAYELRITDQAAAGATGAAESFRTYLCSAPLSGSALLLKDESDSDNFLLDPSLNEILLPLLETPSR